MQRSLVWGDTHFVSGNFDSFLVPTVIRGNTLAQSDLCDISVTSGHPLNYPMKECTRDSTISS